MRSAPRQIGAIGLALLLVATLAINPLGLAAIEATDPVGEAAAQDDPGSLPACTVDILLAGAMTKLGEHPCGYSEIELAEIEENWLSIYTQAGTAHAAADSYRATYSNSLTSSNETAFMMAEQATFEAWTNDSSKMEAKTAGREAIREYYATMQRNLINRWNTQVATTENLYERDGSVSGEQVILQENNLVQGASHNSADLELSRITQFPTENVTLADGETKEMRQMTVEIDGTYTNGGTTYQLSPTTNVTVDLRSHSFSDTIYYGGVNTDDVSGELNSIWVASPPETEYSSTGLLSTTHWTNEWDDTEAYKTAASSRSDQLVETAWTELQDGNINATDYLSRITLIEQYATEGGGENATFSDVQAALMAQGFSAPNGSTAFMNITYEMVNRGSPKTSEGLLLSANGPPATNGSWEVGYEYNSTKIDGGQIVALLDGGSDEINGNFTINSALDAEGNEIEDPSMDVPDRTYEVSDVQALNDRIAELGDRIAELQNMTADDGGGGGGAGDGWQWSGLDIPNFLGFLGEIGKWVQIGLVAFVGLLVLRVVGK